MLREEMGKIISDGLCKSLVEIFEKEDIQFNDVTISELYDWDILVSMAVDLFVRILEQNNKVCTGVLGSLSVISIAILTIELATPIFLAISFIPKPCFHN